MRTRLAAVAVMALTVGLGSASAQSGVGISPARIEQNLQNRSVGFELTVANHDDHRQRISISVAGLGHDLDGTPTFIEPAEATTALKVSDPEFILQGREQKIVSVTGSIPQGQASVYAGIVVQFDSGEEQRVVETVSRVAALVLLRGPRPWAQTAEVIEVSAFPRRTGQPITLFATVKDTGDVHIRPRGRIEAYKDGQLLATVPLDSQTVLPDFARRLTGVWEPPAGLTGRVELVAIIEDPDARGVGYLDFQGGAPSVTAGDIEQVSARPDEGGTIEVVLTNTGTLNMTPTLRITATQADTTAASTALEPGGMAPGDRKRLTWKAGLGAGSYLITARAEVGETLLDQAVTGLLISGPPGSESPKNSLWILVALLLIVGWLVLYYWRGRPN